MAIDTGGRRSDPLGGISRLPHDRRCGRPALSRIFRVPHRQFSFRAETASDGEGIGKSEKTTSGGRLRGEGGLVWQNDRKKADRTAEGEEGRGGSARPGRAGDAARKKGEKKVGVIERYRRARPAGNGGEPAPLERRKLRRGARGGRAGGEEAERRKKGRRSG